MAKQKSLLNERCNSREQALHVNVLVPLRWDGKHTALPVAGGCFPGTRNYYEHRSHREAGRLRESHTFVRDKLFPKSERKLENNLSPPTSP